MKKIIAASIITFAITITGMLSAHAAPATTPAKQAVAAQTATTAEPQKKASTAPAEDKYPATYAKCTKVAETDETKYDQLFEDCMTKNGFPQEEFGTGGMPIDGGENQED